MKRIESILRDTLEKDFSARYTIIGTSEFNKLGKAINDLIEFVGKLSEIRKLREREFNIIFNAIEIPIFIIDNDGRLVISNNASKLLMRPISEGIPRFYYEILKNDALISFVKEALTNPQNLNRLINVDEYSFECFSFPFTSRDEQYVIFMLHDVTESEKVKNLEKEFISSVSHELKTPVSVLKGAVEILEEENLIKKNGEKFFKSIKESTSRMETLASKLLILTEINAWTKPLEEEVDVSEVSRRICKRYEEAIEEKGLDLKRNIKDGVFIKGDIFLIEELVANLVDNALRYTDKGFIEVSVFLKEFATLIVYDTGIGIEEKHLSQLFEPFFREENSRDRARGGSGLGLAISKRITTLHKGKICVESRVGSFTKVTVQFPPLLRKINNNLKIP